MHQKFNPFALKHLHKDVDYILSHISLRKGDLYGKVLKNLMLYGTDRAAGCYQCLSVTHMDVTAADNASQRCGVNIVSTDTHQSFILFIS